MSEHTNWTDGENYLKKTDKNLAALIDKYGHCTLLPVAREKYYITLIKCILSQQVASDVFQRIFSVFTASYGENPSPDAILAAPASEVEACGVSRLKINYIKDLSRHIIEGKIDPSKFSQMSDAAIVKQLTEIKGLGRWTAEIFLILALNRPDVLPADDFGLQKAIKEVFSLPAVMQKRSQMMAFAEKWRPWRSLATWYLWREFDGGRR
ncbi:MAG: hypothetical protein LBP78_08015 [Acidaminococcales bacterium]|jgi:DNA-3-methyladenine glycosylase II|nr:hypothetical protein [Acidaminococcales bacterium]